MISEHTFHDDEHKKAWLIRVTINECKKHFRWLSYQPKSYPKTPEPEEYHDVYSAVMDLPQNYRMVIHLHYYEGLSVKEMSSILEKNENTILSHLHRARKKLKKIMEVDYEYKYKYAMDSIKMKEFTVEELENILIKKRRRSKHTAIAAASGTILLIFIISAGLLFKNDFATITVQAEAGEKMVLSSENTIYNLSSAISTIQFSKNSNSATLSLKLFFESRKKNIDQITVSSSEDKIERKDLEKVNAYFIKTQKLKVSDYGAFSQDIQKDDTFLWSLYDQQTHEVTFKTLIGNSYTFQYEEQDNESYELALNVLKDENDTFSIGDIILKIKIKYLDGTMENKKIKIAANDDISSGLQMKIL